MKKHKKPNVVKMKPCPKSATGKHLWGDEELISGKLIDRQSEQTPNTTGFLGSIRYGRYSDTLRYRCRYAVQCELCEAFDLSTLREVIETKEDSGSLDPGAGNIMN